MRRILIFVAVVAGTVFMVSGVASAFSCKINGGDTFTNVPNVNVSYSLSFDDYRATEFRVSDQGFWLTPADEGWQPIPDAPYRHFPWSFSLGDGVQTISMQFRSGEDDHRVDFWEQCRASITLDTTGPVGRTFSTNVRRGATATVSFWLTDTYSPTVIPSVFISTLSGRVVMSYPAGREKASGVYQHWRLHCTLKRGTYQISVDGRDELGNAASSIGHAKLRVW